jgi:hypothetical protein
MMPPLQTNTELSQSHLKRWLRLVVLGNMAAFIVWTAASCERYEQKKAARERRMEYLRSLTDSARKAHDAQGDSVRMLKEQH